MIIGHFTYDTRTDSFQGAVVTVGFDYPTIKIKPTRAANRREPAYRITAVTAGGGEVELGAGWKRTGSQGREFVSVTLDSPWLPAPVNAGLFTEADGKAALIWTRPRVQPRNAARPAPQAG